MKEQMIKTGTILPRYYGIRLKSQPGRSVFFTPLHYAKAMLMLASERKLSNALKTKFEVGEISDIFSVALVKKEGSDDLIRYGKDHFLSRIFQYGTAATGSVKGSTAEYNVQLDIPYLESNGLLQFKRVESTSPDEFWGQLKLQGDLVTKHVALLHLATSPSTSPFNLKDNRWINLLWSHYVNKQSYFQVDRVALENEDYLTQRTLKAIRKGNAGMNVLRQNEERRSLEKLTADEINYFKSAVAYRNNLAGRLRSKGFVQTGYALEFYDTPHETVAFRYRQRGSETVFHLCPTKLGIFLVERKLHDFEGVERYPNFFKPYEGYAQLGAAELFSKDDVTRRDSLATTVRPAEHELTKTVYVPKAMQERYELET